MQRLQMCRVAAVMTLGALVALPSCSASESGGPSASVPSSDRPSADAPATGDSSTEAADGYQALFDGTQQSLDEWRMAGPGEFVLQADGSILSVGGMGLLWYPEEFGSYRLRLDWKVEGDDNSGVFVGFPDPGDDPQVAVDRGYEIQIDATDEPDRTTGAIYAFQGADTEARDAALNPPGMWNTYEIVVAESVIEVHLNGELVNRFESSDPDRDLAEGFVGLQNHGEDDQVYFRDIRVAGH